MLKIIRLVFATLYFLSYCLIAVLLCFLRPRHPNNTRDLCIPVTWARRFLGIHFTRLNETPLPDQPAVYIGNHQDTLDLFICTGCLPPRTTLIGKSSLKYIPLFGWAYWLAGNIFLDRENRSKAWVTMTKVAKVMVRRRLAIYLFPEGTRSRGRGLLPFKSGAFVLAIEAQVPIIPVCFSSTHKNIDLNRWHAGFATAQYLEPISTEGLTRRDAKALALQCHELMARQIDEMDGEIATRYDSENS